MKRFLGAALAVSIVCVSGGLSRADDKDATPILDKAIKAIGGEEKLSKIKAYSVKTKGTITLGGNDNEFTGKSIHEGPDHFRSEFEGRFGDNDVKGVTVVNGDKGWRKFGDMETDMDGDQLTNEKRTVYLSVIPSLIVHVKGKGFKVEAAGEEKVGDKPAVVVKITGPEGKDFKLFFDKESGLPVKSVATVLGIDGTEFSSETTYENYKDFDGIKRATKMQSKRDGEKFVSAELTEFKVLDKVEPETFSQPK
jgi:outer membrane lipoprotein-sorting protein